MFKQKGGQNSKMPVVAGRCRTERPAHSGMPECAGRLFFYKLLRNKTALKVAKKNKIYVISLFFGFYKKTLPTISL